MQADYSQRFIFDEFDIRGEVVQLEHSYAELLSTHHYPGPVANLLGEFMSACVLMSGSIKYEGRLSLQARSNGPVPLIMVECSSALHVRGLAQLGEQALDASLGQLLAEGTLAITIEPEQGERYQGLVPLQADRLSACLDHYFYQSEQLETRFYFAADGTRAAGLMLQQLPRQAQNSELGRAQSWEHVSTLAQTLEDDELLRLNPEELLYRLYHQDKVRLFKPRPVAYRCSCSWERTTNTLRSLGRAEAFDILEEQSQVEMTCEFCNQVYLFDRSRVNAIFSEDPPQHSTDARQQH
jgi:molecular chaperone Hsp33